MSVLNLCHFTEVSPWNANSTLGILVCELIWQSSVIGCNRVFFVSIEFSRFPKLHTSKHMNMGVWNHLVSFSSVPIRQPIKTFHFVEILQKSPPLRERNDFYAKISVFLLVCLARIEGFETRWSSPEYGVHVNEMILVLVT